MNNYQLVDQTERKKASKILSYQYKIIGFLLDHSQNNPTHFNALISSVYRTSANLPSLLASRSSTLDQFYHLFAKALQETTDMFLSLSILDILFIMTKGYKKARDATFLLYDQLR